VNADHAVENIPPSFFVLLQLKVVDKQRRTRYTVRNVATAVFASAPFVSLFYSAASSSSSSLRVSRRLD
jgi:hypothetical protein